jgi:hypothetical protein
VRRMKDVLVGAIRDPVRRMPPRIPVAGLSFGGCGVRVAGEWERSFSNAICHGGVFNK